MTKASVHGVLMTGAVAVAIGLSTAHPSDGRPAGGSASTAVSAVAALGTEAAELGTISGIVRFESEVPPQKRIRVTADNENCGTHKLSERFLVSPETKGLKNVLVTVEGVVGGRAATPDKQISLEQRSCMYVPHFQVAQLGPEGIAVEIRNTDPTLHNIHAYHGRTTLFNIGQPASGRTLTKKLTTPGVVRVRCDVHRWMSAFIVVLENQPYYTVTDENGNFSIEGVPVGSYTLRAWHEAIGEVKKPVAVTAAETTRLDFIIAPDGGD